MSRWPAAPADVLFEPVPARDFVAALRATVAQWEAEPDWRGDECNIVLALARIWYSAATGAIAPKDVAAAWVLERVQTTRRGVTRVRPDALRQPAVPAKAAFSAASSNFVICIIAAATRPALTASRSAIIGMSASGTICHDTP